MSFDPSKLDELKQFVDAMKGSPQLLNLPVLAFVKDWVESLGGQVPDAPTPVPDPEPHSHSHDHGESCAHDHGPASAPPAPEPEEEEDLDVIEPMIEFEPLKIDGDEDLAEEDADALEMGDKDKEVSEADSDQASAALSAAKQAMGSDKADAVGKCTEAIKLDASGTRAFAFRAKMNIKLKKPHSAIKDADAVLERNPDSAQGYKWRGKAHAMIGEYKKANEDLAKAQAIDFDDETHDWIPPIKDNAVKMAAHEREYDRLFAEREKREKIRRRKKAQRDYKKQKTTQEPSGGGFPGGGMPGGMPGGGMPGGGMPGMPAGMDDPEIMAAMQDLMANMSNPAATMAKYASNPKVMAFLSSMMGQMGGGGMGGMFGGMGGGGGMPGGFPGAEADTGSSATVVEEEDDEMPDLEETSTPQFNATAAGVDDID